MATTQELLKTFENLPRHSQTKCRHWPDMERDNKDYEAWRIKVLYQKGTLLGDEVMPNDVGLILYCCDSCFQEVKRRGKLGGIIVAQERHSILTVEGLRKLINEGQKMEPVTPRGRAALNAALSDRN